MVTSLRMHATTLWGFPFALRRSANARITGLQRIAENAAMEPTVRPPARPPRIERLRFDGP